MACFDCLQRRIESDFSGHLLFSYGLSDSAFPLASSAVVQVSLSPASSISNFFVLEQMPTSTGEAFSAPSCRFILELSSPHPFDCLPKYVDEYIACYTGLSDSHRPDPLAIEPEPQSPYDDGKLLVNVVGSQTPSCTHSKGFSCSRIINALAPFAHIGVCSYSVFQNIASSFLSGSLEDHILHSLNLFIQGKSSSRDSINFLHLLGIPSFDETSIPGCLRHPNIVPILGCLRTSDTLYTVIPKSPYTLQSILYFCPGFIKSEWHIRFLLYQILSALASLHGLGVPHGNIHPSNIMLTDLCWSSLRLCKNPKSRSNSVSRFSECKYPAASDRIRCCMDGCSSQGLYADLNLSLSMDWHSQFDMWWRGELSNFQYLLLLNKLAGRRWGDNSFHTVMPWVIDFSTKPDENSDLGWRDLSKSKWRLAKGDEQLDFTYSTSEIPHHVSDECLSELAVCSYKARRLSLSVLRLAVRSVYEPNEYPSNMLRLYQWTPDECIPEFFCDPQIFYSLHSGMADLAVPSWADSPEEFVKLHRDALESHRVSSQIHHWIDITFGYKMSGRAAFAAKNVMLPSSEPMTPRSAGRRQLFTQPHPARLASAVKQYTANSSAVPNGVEVKTPLLFEASYLEKLEAAALFSEHAGHLSPQYSCDQKSLAKEIPFVQESVADSSNEGVYKPLETFKRHGLPSQINLSCLLEHIKHVEGSTEYQELLLWRKNSSCSTNFCEDLARDMFSVGCVLAELYMKRPLFSSTSLTAYTETGILPESILELPPPAKVLVEACIQKDWTRRPSAKCVLESPYFPATVKSAYVFTAPLQLLASNDSRLQYAANFTKQGALKAMGAFAAEMCAPFCLPLVINPQSDAEAEWAYVLLEEFIKCLTPKAVKTLVLPAIQKILQISGYSHLKVLLLQGSFVQEIWNLMGRQIYLETIHPLVISNLYVTPHKSSASAASVLLIGTSEELGIPITINQTILPLIHCFGKGLCPDGIDVLVRIGSLLGESFIVRQMLPLLKQVVHSCISISVTNKLEPVQSWSALALIDCLSTLDGLVAFLSKEVIVKELIEDKGCVHVTVLMQTNLEIPVIQVAATTLMAVCQRIGPELTASHVLPQLKELFDELAFSREAANDSGSSSKSSRVPKSAADEVHGETQVEGRMDLVLFLYPSFASLLGIEKLRQCCATWLLLEQFLLRCHNWKWEHSGEPSQSGAEIFSAKWPPFNKSSKSEDNPAKLLLNGVGWSVPQSQGIRGSKNMAIQKHFDGIHHSSDGSHLATSNLPKREPWFWFPTPNGSWGGPDYLWRVVSLKDGAPWKIRASVLYSIRAHHGALRSLAVSQDECRVFTAGTGPGFKGTVQKWELSRINCVSGYYGHEEAVNSICVLSSGERIASSDGSIHVWNSRTGKVLSVFGEPSADSAHMGSTSSSASKFHVDHPNIMNSNTLSSGLLASAFDGSLYTCMHYLESLDTLVAGTGNGSLRFIDVSQGRKLHLWRSDTMESAFPSLISTLCSCGSDKTPADGTLLSPSWIAAGLSSGHCKIFDMRSGDVVASWKAHDGYVTKLASVEDHLLVSSSLDRTLRIWDLRRTWPPQAIVFKGHTNGVSSFSVWGQDVISISKNKIGLSTLSGSDEDGQQQILPQKLYTVDHGMNNLSVLSTISILPFSRLFVVGTEDGYLRICC